ncbi:MAG: preprotein translocase subunit SecA [Acidobacteriota bacterium]|jgi:preprotein translocase subunit SecA|nr:preprotein translocase subunit SecA [Acidobacteriota bacterium]
MFSSILTKIVGSKNDRDLKQIMPIIQQVNALEPEMSGRSDEELAALTPMLRERLVAGETLDDILPEAFALVREVSKRTLKMRHFDVQLVGGIVLHRGRISEMKTGEGKTLVATLPAYLNALEGKGVHVVTVNDYLAGRDSEWMGRLYRKLGLTVGCIQHPLTDAERKVAYAADITYGTNNEFGFDYLRDNMKYDISDCVQRGYNYAIVDEVDSILIDEARTPLIISGPAEESTDKYYKVDRIVPRLRRDIDFQVDEKARTVNLTEEGVEKAEQLLAVGNLYEPQNMDWVHHTYQALKAHLLFKRDVDYMVKDGEVVIVDEFTGRLMPGRRYSDGLHQALEAKENVKIERENQTLATITFQNYFRMYKKLAGMTGTAETEAEEFYKIYKLEVNVIPTNRPLTRTEFPDVIYRTEREKYSAVVEEIKELHEKGRPVLVGTVSIEKSEKLSVLLKRAGVPHVVLNAKYHAKEAEIVAQAGRKKAVTIATNMAGRGTDILLGGNPEFLTAQSLREKGLDPATIPPEELQKIEQHWEAACPKEREEVVGVGGLHILGTERHEARRIDNQLRGRAGRQGDPGTSRFYLSLEDDLMRIFASDRISGIMQSLGMEEGVPIESKLITRQIERAQRQVEARNFEIRKHLLEYDDVMNKQREAIYAIRHELLEGTDQKEYVQQLSADITQDTIDQYASREKAPDTWDVEALRVGIGHQFGIDINQLGIDFNSVNYPELVDKLNEAVRTRYEEKEQRLGTEYLRYYERIFMLQVLDAQWKEHLWALDHLKEGIGLRGYGQRDPLMEYKKESFDMFEALRTRIEEESIRVLYLFEPIRQEEAEARERAREEARRRALKEQNLVYQGAGSSSAESAPASTVKNQYAKVGRNDLCPCGSGKKFKKCHGA